MKPPPPPNRRQGFQLQDPEVDDVVRAARDLEAARIQPDAALPDAENVQLLLRAGRLLQLGLEVQFAEVDALLAENNGLRDDLRVRAAQESSRAQHIRLHRKPLHAAMALAAGSSRQRGAPPACMHATDGNVHAGAGGPGPLAG